jgi:hypothetical protein
MTYESWRISYQSSEQAARAAFGEAERLRAALLGCVELAEFWIGQGREPNMSKERYGVWLALGHRSQQLQAAKAAVSPMTPNAVLTGPDEGDQI